VEPVLFSHPGSRQDVLCDKPVNGIGTDTEDRSSSFNVENRLIHSFLVISIANERKCALMNANRRKQALTGANER